MGKILDALRNTKPVKKLLEEIKEFDLAQELDEKFRFMDDETGTRLADYRLFTNYYNGDQKQYRKRDPGRTNKEWNLCRPTIDTFTSLVFGESVKMVSTPDWETNKIEDVQTVAGEQEEQSDYPVEYSRAQFIDKLLEKIFGSKFHIESLDAEHNGSKLGAGAIQWGWDKEKKRPFFASIYPGFCRFAWRSQDFSELEYVFISVPMSVTEFEKKYGFGVDESSIETSVTIPEMEHEMFNDLNKQPKVLVQHYYDDKVHIIKVGNRIVRQDGKLASTHNYGTVPITLFLSNKTADKPLGDSDIRDGIKIQKDINSTLSGWFDLSKSDEGTKTIVPGGVQQTMDALSNPGSGVVGSNRDGAQPYILARSGQQPDLQARLSFLRDGFFQTVGLSQSFTAAPDTSVITQVGINALNFPTLIRLKPRMAQRMNEVQKLVTNVLKMYEKFGGVIPNTNLTYKEMIDKHYDIDIQFNVSTPRDEAVNTQMELFKLDRRIQSRGQTMQNLGVKNPLEEIEQIAFEENNPMYSPDKAMEERRMELAENAQQQAQPVPEQEVAGQAQQENQLLQQGQNPPVNEETPRDNQIHLTIHDPFIKQLQEITGALTEESQKAQGDQLLQVAQQHVDEHKTRLAALQGGGGAGAPQNPGAGAGQGAFGGRPPAAEGAFNPPTAQGQQPPVPNTIPG